MLSWLKNVGIFQFNKANKTYFPKRYRPQLNQNLKINLIMISRITGLKVDKCCSDNLFTTENCFP